MIQKRIGRELRCTSNLFRRSLENTNDFQYIDNITGSNAFILGYIVRNQDDFDIYQKTIEEKFLITKSTISKTLTIMEQHGLIERVTVNNDARLKKIIATKKGKEIARKVKNSIDIIEEQTLSGFTEEEKESLFLYLERIKENLKNKE